MHRKSMKRCPECRRDYYDDTLQFCLDDGATLVYGGAAGETPTEILEGVPSFREAPTRRQDLRSRSPDSIRTKNWFFIGIPILSALLIGSFFAYRFLFVTGETKIQSIAVMPFVNESGNPDLEYLSDGMTETLINNLSQLPNLNVKARSSVFRYKGKDVQPQAVGSELNVQAVLNGRIVQRGENLTLYLSLVNAQTGDQIWGEPYERNLADLVSLQGEIARDVSRKLGARLSGAEEKKLSRNYTANADAYQHYLRGRFYTLKVTRAELLKAIPYFEKAIEIDRQYALAYVGLADAYRGLTLGGEMEPIEYLPKAKKAAEKAVEIDDQLAEAHAVLGWIVYWYDWDFPAAETHCKRALQLDPDSSDAHMAYAHVLSSTGRHAEANAEARRAREIEPLNIRTNTLEAQFLIYAGRPDEALDRLHHALELDPEYFLAYQFLASAYIDKGFYAEAIAAGRKGYSIYSKNTRNLSFTACALAKSGRENEARATLTEFLKPEEGTFIPPFNIAIVYNCLGDRENTLAWLRRGIEQRDPRMVFLPSEPKWKNLHDDPGFQEILKKVHSTS
jgi:TolB-like protein/Tfp pilus assembly protein PilF